MTMDGPLSPLDLLRSCSIGPALRIYGFQRPVSQAAFVAQVVWAGRITFHTGRVAYSFWYNTIAIPDDEVQRTCDPDRYVRSRIESAVQRIEAIVKHAAHGLLVNNGHARRIASIEWLLLPTEVPFDAVIWRSRRMTKMGGSL